MSLLQSTLKLLLYFDVFDHPLTAPELAWFCGIEGSSTIDKQMETLVKSGIIACTEGYYHVAGRNLGVAKRKTGSKKAEELWPNARRSAALLARIPWVKGVFITGSLSKRCVGPDSDVDFLLVIEPDRVWLTKSSLQVFRKVLPERIRVHFCTNYLISMSHLAIPEQNMFTAVELATAIPMWGSKACTALIQSNDWAKSFIPGYDACVQRAENAPSMGSPDTDSPRSHTFSGLAKRLDGRAMAAWSLFWNKKYRWLNSETRNKRFKRTPTVATNHLNDFQGWVLEEWQMRLQQYTVDEH